MPEETVSDEEVQETRDEVERLRAELAEKNNELARSEASRNNAASKSRLDNEVERLKQQLAAVDRQLEVSQTAEIVRDEAATAPQSTMTASPDDVEAQQDSPSRSRKKAGTTPESDRSEAE